MKNIKKGLVLVLAAAMVVSMVGCENNKNNNVTNTPTPTGTTPTPASKTEVQETKSLWDGAYIEEDDFKAYIDYDLDNLVGSMADQLTADQTKAVNKAAEDGHAAIAAAKTVAEVKAAYDKAYDAVLACVPVYNGTASFMMETNAERTNILGILESYAVTTGTTGISLFEDGGYVMYNPRITLGTENYIVGYGFGTLAEGAITADLDYETVAAWKRYYHTFETADPGTLNYLNDKGETVGDLYAYVAASYFTNFMNKTKDGYDWVPELAMEKPQPVNDTDGDGVCSTWRFQVRTGNEGLKYTTGSSIPSRQAFNNRPVALEDYETGWKLLLTQKNQYVRGSEQANSTSGAIVGLKDYYNGTVEGFNQDLWDKVGIKTYVENGKSYFEYTFTQEYSQFYAMYYINSSTCMPIPQEFIDLVTTENYLGFNKAATESPVDNALVLGSYYLEQYDSDQQIVFKKNPNYVYADTKYAVPGIHIKIFPAAKENTSAGLNEFLAGHFDASGIPKEFLDEYRNDPRTRTTTGTSNFKLNVNACDEATWEYFFGENGTVEQNKKEDYWALKPVLGNAHFVKALSYSIDRLTFANTRGSIPSVDFFASNYMSDPENGIAYSSTNAHAKAVEILKEGTDGFGYSLELARDYFRVALTELENEGKIKPGTKEKPTVVDLELAWMYPTHEENYHNEIKNFFETAFNDDSVCGGVYKLNAIFWVGNEWSDVYYNKLLVGKYDIGFGSISGSSLDPLGFMNVLSSDMSISNSFTLNWGKNTNDPDSYPIVYKGYRYSYDALYNAATGKAIVENGESRESLTFTYNNLTKNADGSYSGSFVVKATLPNVTKFTATQVACCNYERYYNGDGTYDETILPVETTENNGVYTVTFTVPADLAADYAIGSGTSAAPEGYTGFDLYYNLDFDGSVQNGLYYSVEDYFK